MVLRARRCHLGDGPVDGSRVRVAPRDSGRLVFADCANRASRRFLLRAEPGRPTVRWGCRLCGAGEAVAGGVRRRRPVARRISEGRVIEAGGALLGG